jgi:Fe-S-cluster containining protein
MSALEQQSPERAAAVTRRAQEAVAVMTPGFPGDAAAGVLGEDERAEEAFCERHASLPCPALDPATGACDLYSWRPISCRTYGPPVRFGDQELPPCRLWFQSSVAGGAPGPIEAIERARVEPDPDDQERDLLEAVNVEGEVGETFVAFALTRGRDR